MRRTNVLLASACLAAVCLVGIAPEKTTSAAARTTAATTTTGAAKHHRARHAAHTPLPKKVVKRLAHKARTRAAADATHDAAWHFRRLCRQWRRIHGHTLTRGDVAPLPKAVIRQLTRTARRLDARRPGHTAYRIFIRLAADWRHDHRRPGPADVVPAITTIARTYGLDAAGMLRVARCESNLYRRATNGQYLGLFQLGQFAREKYLDGDWDDAYANAEAAARYVRDAHGWGPWSCGFSY